jgi:ribosomal protein S18 acetylase RimI-like enzyme
MSQWRNDNSWSVLDRCDPADRSFLSDQINAFNVQTTGIDDGRELAVIVRGRDGEIVAGIYGWTWGGFCEIETLWVDQGLRHQGLGTALLRAAEREAIDRGVRQIGLDTHSFQAPDFYAAHGYVVIGTQNDYPLGHAKIYLTKRL